MNKNVLKKQQDKANDMVFEMIKEIVKKCGWDATILSLQTNLFAILSTVNDECEEKDDYTLLNMYLNGFEELSMEAGFQVFSIYK